MGKRLALVLLEQQDLSWQSAPLEHQPPRWPDTGALFSPWSAIQAVVQVWMRLFTGWWNWTETSLLRRV